MSMSLAPGSQFPQAGHLLPMQVRRVREIAFLEGLGFHHQVVLDERQHTRSTRETPVPEDLAQGSSAGRTAASFTGGPSAA
jgi:hypothetical protein